MPQNLYYRVLLLLASTISASLLWGSVEGASDCRTSANGSAGTTSSEGYAGSLKGHFGVTSNGSASYAVALDVPPGTRGMQPHLSLAYDSVGSDGMLGIGWRLQGLSRITRVPMTRAQDGTPGAINYDSNDRFALDGLRLIAPAEEYGADGTEYRTELETWRKIVSRGAVKGGSGPQSFTVQTKNGLTLQYGQTADSRIAATGKSSIRVWALNRVADLNNNVMTITYCSYAATGDYYPDTITYTEDENLPAGRTIEFTYVSRSQDQVPLFDGGSSVTTTKLLTSIQTSVSNEAVRAYTFAYGTSSATGRYLLTSVTEADSTGKELTPTIFTYTEGDTAIFLDSSPVSIPEQGSRFLPMDANGDGFIDLVTAWPDDNTLNLQLYLADGTGGFDSPSKVPTFDLFFTTFLHSMDVNADGMIDLVHGMLNDVTLTVTVLLSYGTGFEQLQPPTTVSVVISHLALPMDVTGDGKVDLTIVTSDDGKLNFQVLTSKGDGFTPGSSTTTQIEYLESDPVYPMDFNADGMSDLLVASGADHELVLSLLLAELSPKGSSDAIYTLVPQSQPLLPLPSGAPVPPWGSGTTLVPMDINADGHGDFVYAVGNDGVLKIYSFVSNGVSFQQPKSVQPQTIPLGYTGVLLPMEVNGDGLPDLVIANNNDDILALSVYLSNGVSFDPAVNAHTPDGQQWTDTLLPMDLNGDGKTALLRIFLDNVTLSANSILCATPFPDLLESATNGLGGEIQVTYLPMTAPSVRGTRTTAQPGHASAQSFIGLVNGSSYAFSSDIQLPASPSGASAKIRTDILPRRVVSTYSTNNGQENGKFSYNYTYSGPKLSLRGRGWLGFAAITRVDTNVKTSTTTTYIQAFPETRQPSSSTTVSIENGKPLHETRHEYVVTHPPSSQGAFQDHDSVYVVRRKSLQRNFYTYGIDNFTVNTSFRYDEYGNAVRVATKVKLDSPDISYPSAPLYTFHTYSNDPDTWLLGFRTEKRVAADAAGTDVLTWWKRTYKVATMNLASVSHYDDQGQTWLTTTYGYDAFGNRTQTTDPSKAVVELTYDDTYHTFPATRVAHVNATRSLTESFVYDALFGTLQSRTDANGNIFKREIDGLGRLIARVGPNPDDPGEIATVRYVRTMDDTGHFYIERQQLVDWRKSSTYYARRAYKDGFGRTFRRTSPAVDSSNIRTMDYVRDSKGRVIKRSVPYFPSETPADSAPHWTRKYDEYSRLIEVVEPTGNGGTVVTEIGYPDGATKVVTQAKGTSSERTTTQTFGRYNGRSRVVGLTNADGATSQFTYDPLGRGIASVAPQGLTETAAYDSLGRRISLQSALGDKVFWKRTHSYRDDQRTVTVTDSKGNEIIYTYDALHRLAQVSVAGEGNTIYTYDEPSSSNGQGRLSSVVTPEGVLHAYGYDPYGRYAAVTISIDGFSYPFEQDNAPRGMVTWLTFPDGDAFLRVYYANGSLKSVDRAPKPAIAPGDFVSYVAYSEFTAFNAPQSMAFRNGLAKTFQFDQVGRLEADKLAEAEGGDTLAGHRYSHTPLAQLSAIDDLVDAASSRTFGYDPVGRLVTAGSDMFEYDPSGNITLKDEMKRVYEGDQVVSGARDQKTVFTAKYDAAGNLFKKSANGDTRTYTYDGRNRLIALGGITFTYDHRGRRVKKAVAGGATTYYLGPRYEVTTLAGSDFRQATKYVIGPAGRVAAVTTEETPGRGRSGSLHDRIPAPEARFRFLDHATSTIALSNDAGVIRSTARYAPYGVPTVSGDDFRYKFTGKELDESTGLYYFGARYYDPDLARFITADTTLGGPRYHTDSYNRYAYALNDPINNIDPTPLCQHT